MEELSEDLKRDLSKLDAWDDAYYNKTELVDDATYDAFLNNVLHRLPSNHPRLSKIGHPICSAWEKSKHIIFMGSQNKVTTEEAISEWVSQTLEKLSIKQAVWVLQHKIDGFSLELQYSRLLKKALTRGEGLLGEDIKDNAMLFRYIPHKIIVDKIVAVRAEGVIYTNDFECINATLSTENKYKNARNAAAGIGRRLDGHNCKFIRAIAYDVNANVERETDKINTLRKLGFKTVESYPCTEISQILEVYRNVRDNVRDNLPYHIDGLVLKLDSLKLQDKLGIDRGRPKGQIAFKWEADKGFTTIKNIVIQLGRTGRLTPIAEFEPVNMSGSTITFASVHNFDYIKNNKIGPGAEVSLTKRGEIIPQIEDVLMPGEDFIKPTKCPSCGGPLVDDSVNLWCRNKGCREREVNRILYWVQTLDMKGFSGKFIEKLWDSGKLKSVADLYRLKEDDFISMDGIGEKTVKAFFEVLKDTSEMFLEQFIVALGVPTCSKSTAAILVENFGTWDKIVAVTPNDLQKLPGFAETSSTTVCEGIAEVADMAAELLKVIKLKTKKAGPLTGMSFCVTGSLAAMGRKEFYELVIEKGGVAKNSVSEGLGFLVTNDTDSGSAKNQKAKKYGVKIINEEAFFKLAGDSPAKEQKKEDSKKDTVKVVSENLFG